jgi:hypothetical protein
MMFMKRLLMQTILVLALFQYSCIKEPDYEELSDNFIVATNTDSLANFGSYATYYISDSVAVINNNTTDTILKNASTQKLVDAVKANMNARGYTFAAKGAKPDLGINLGIAKNTYVGVIYSGWWDAYAGWWDPWYWGWYYPYYYPWATYYSITTGTVIVTMADLKNAQASQTLRIVWNAIAGGAVGDNLDANVDRGVEAINQAFVQSPLVKRN